MWNGKEVQWLERGFYRGGGVGAAVSQGWGGVLGRPAIMAVIAAAFPREGGGSASRGLNVHHGGVKREGERDAGRPGCGGRAHWFGMGAARGRRWCR